MADPLPRVTDILRSVGLGPDLSMVPPATLAAALERGAAVHEAIEAWAYGYLTPDLVPPYAAPYFDAYLKFMAESGAELIAAEIEVVNATWGYRGHPDLVCWIGKTRVIIDAKTGADDGVEYQVVAYVDGWNAEHQTEQVVAGACLNLRDDGTYRLREIDLNAARPVWYGAVTVFHAQKRRAA